MIPTFDFKNVISAIVRGVLVGGVFNPVVFYGVLATSFALILTLVFDFFSEFTIPTISVGSLSVSGNACVNFVGYLLACDTLFTLFNFVITCVNKVIPFGFSLVTSLIGLWAVVNSARAVRRWIVELTS